MSDTNIYPFQKLYDDLHHDKEKHLMLGNGFSIGADKRFAYKSLYEAAELSEEAKAIFDAYKTTNFEDVIRYLDIAINAINALPSKVKLDNINELEEQKELIKSLLVRTVAKIHPDQSEIVKNNDMKCCGDFISCFTNVFTFNYDLLLYWVAMLEKINCTDGFKRIGRNCSFIDRFKPEKSKFIYLHGAMHLFDYKKATYKRVATTNQTVKKMVQEAMDHNKYPLAVTEGDSQSKKNKIEKNDYLKKCWKRFRNIGGAIFSYGLSFCEQDDHIIQAIIANKKIQKLYIGFHDDKKMIEDNISEIRKKRSDIHIQYFRSEEANVWGD